MKRNLLIFLSVLVFVVAADRVMNYYYDRASPEKRMALKGEISQTALTETKETPKAMGKITDIPNFALNSLDGKVYHLNDFKGKIVLMNFWATWCPPCVVEFPKLLKLAKAQPDMVVVLLSSDIGRKNIQDFIARQPQEIGALAKLPNVIIAKDQRSAVTAGIFQTYKLPETVILDQKGQFMRKIVGDIDWLAADIQDYFRKISAQRED